MKHILVRPGIVIVTSTATGRDGLHFVARDEHDVCDVLRNVFCSSRFVPRGIDGARTIGRHKTPSDEVKQS
jgi:hypothetical protein